MVMLPFPARRVVYLLVSSVFRFDDVKGRFFQLLPGMTAVERYE
jgi:hypothetical protein